jgi:hypothetical protein
LEENDDEDDQTLGSMIGRLAEATFNTREPRVKLPVLKLNVESRTVTHPVSSRGLFAPNNNFLCMESESFCLYEAAGANNDIKHCDAFFFARNPIGITHNQLVAVLTNGIHIFLDGQGTCHQIDL